MPQQTKLVFVGRETEVNREDFHDIHPSVEQDDDEMAARESEDELVRSDLQAYDSDGDEDKDEDEDNDENDVDETEDAAGPRTSHVTHQKSTSSSSRPKRGLRARQTDTLKQVPQGAIRKTRPTAAKTRLKTKKTTGAVKQAAGCGKTQEWEVEKIVSSLIEEGTLKHFYKVKWKGFSSQHNT